MILVSFESAHQLGKHMSNPGVKVNVVVHDHVLNLDFLCFQLWAVRDLPLENANRASDDSFESLHPVGQHEFDSRR
jgi:hypothetical protein